MAEPKDLISSNAKNYCTIHVIAQQVPFKTQGVSSFLFAKIGAFTEIL
jgi:hypothetical protein